MAGEGRHPRLGYNLYSFSTAFSRNDASRNVMSWTPLRPGTVQPPDTQSSSPNTLFGGGENETVRPSTARSFHDHFTTPATLQAHHRGLGDRQSTMKSPMSPLDNTYPPVGRYLMSSSPGPLGSSVRNKFEPRFRVMRACCQIEPIPINIFCWGLDGIAKLNEGVFGEVYVGQFNHSPVESVYKVVPIEGSITVNGEVQKRFDQIETELRVSQRLNSLKEGGQNKCDGFCQLFRARVLSGAYPEVLVRAWKKWHRQHQSENDVPNFGENQLYVVFEYEHCGTDMESFCFRNAEQAYMTLLQVAFSLAVAEAQVDFEHRDLHWGNILVKPTDKVKLDFRLEGVNYSVPSGGLKMTIIDFTMSRCSDEDGQPVFDDLQNDETQFAYSGSEYQFEIYRKMRAINNNNWSDFHPRTNTFWLHYVADKLLQKASYSEKVSRRHKVYHKMIKDVMDQIQNFASCADYVKTLTRYVTPGQAVTTSGHPPSAPRN